VKRASASVTEHNNAVAAAFGYYPPPVTALRPDQAVRLDLLRIVMIPTLMRDAGVAIKVAAQLEDFVMNGAAQAETGGQGSQPPA
jgi:hypothetical protein